MVLEARNLSKRYGNQKILDNVSLQIAEGEVVVIIGPSGSGKSTLLRILNGLEDIQSGEIYFQGRKVEANEQVWQKLRPEIGMVFQSYDLFPNKTVLENCTVAPVKVQGRKLEEVRGLVERLLEKVGLAGYADRMPSQLSGGQQQRVAIVRTLAMQPKVLLLDEITAALDPEVVQDVLRVILDLAEEKTTMLIVTHEMGFARQVSDRVIFLDRGVIVEEAATDKFFDKPETQRAREFIDAVEFGSI